VIPHRVPFTIDDLRDGIGRQRLALGQKNEVRLEALRLRQRESLGEAPSHQALCLTIVEELGDVLRPAKSTLSAALHSPRVVTTDYQYSHGPLTLIK
jgi:hypothetical protein